MTLAEFHTMVSGIINRGTKYDTDIVAAVRQAARHLERTQTWKYMDHMYDFAITADDEEVQFDFGVTLKVIHFFRLLITDATVDEDFQYLKKGMPRDFLDQEPDRPQHYWLEEEENRIIVHPKPDDDYDSEFFVAQYTTWPTDTSEEPWLVNNAEDALLAQTMIYMAPILRNPRIAQDYAPILQASLIGLVTSDEELKREDGFHAMKMYTG